MPPHLPNGLGVHSSPFISPAEPLMEACREPAYVQNAVSFSISLVFWVASFYGCWFFFPRWGKTSEKWQEMNKSEKYGLCGLLFSTLHGIIVPTGIVICMTECKIWGDWMANNCTSMEIVFAWTASYFTVDSVLIVYYRGASWQVFLAHHLVGCMPFFINCFGCSNLHFLVGGGILIEAICPCLNLRALLETFGKKHTARAAWAFVVTYAIWIPLRVALPLYLSIGMISETIPNNTIVAWAVVPSYVTGICITLFSVAVWLAVLSPEIPWAYRLIAGRARVPGDNIEELPDTPSPLMGSMPPPHTATYELHAIAPPLPTCVVPPAPTSAPEASSNAVGANSPDPMRQYSTAV